MTKSLPLALAVALGLFAGRSPAAPALGDKPARYEYAELKYTTFRAPAVQPGGGPRVGVPHVTIKWITADEEIDATEWEDLANKLKAPAAKKDGGSVTQHKLRVLNRLSADGWEIVEHTGTDGTAGIASWVLRRRVP
jgi:hypothetical protein